MWEFCLIFDSQNVASAFRFSIYKKVKSLNGVSTLLVDENFSKVLIAIPEVCKKDFFGFLKDKIAENILLYYKHDYICSKLKFLMTTSTNMQVFIKALTVFDSDTDKDIIKEKLIFKNKLFVTSFIDFKLNFLKRKWDELVSLANDNEMYLFDDSSFNELIKFLISNLEYRYYAVNIFSKKNCYLICDYEGNNIVDFLIDKNIFYDDNKLLTALIALNPEKIIIHCNSFVKDKLIKNLFAYFSNRVEVCK